MANLYDKAGLVNIPVGYQDGFLYNIKPEDNTLGFRFNRDSAATRVNKEGLIEQVGYFGPELVQNGNFSELGPELVVNGNFDTDSDWTKAPSGVTISGGLANFNSLTDTYIYQDILTANKTYKIIFSGTINSGSFYIGENGSAINIYTVGTYTNEVAYFTVSSSARFIIRKTGTGTLDATIDNVSVKQVDPNDYWTLGTGWSIEDGRASYDGTGGTSFIRQNDVIEVGKTYKVTLEVLANEGSGINTIFLGGTVLNSSHLSVGSYTFYGSTNNTSVTLTIYGRSGEVFEIDNVSVVEVLGDKPRIDYTDSLTSPSFLLEPQSTNLITYSEDFSQSSWTKNNTSVLENNTISPSGIINAYKLIEDTSNSQHSIYDNVSWTSGQEYTFSAFAKKDERNIIAFVFPYTAFGSWKYVSFNLENGTTITVDSGVTANIEDYGNGWYKCSATSTPNATTSADMTMKIQLIGNFQGESYLGDGTSGLYIWGAQLEESSYPTSYIPTSGSTVTRAQETCNGAGNVSTFNSTEGVLYAEIAALADDLTFRVVSLSDGSNSNIIKVGYRTTSNAIYYEVRSGDVSQAFQIYTTTDVKQFHKVAVLYQQNNFKLFINGVNVLSDTSGITPIGLNNISFEANNGAYFYGKTKGVYAFNEALTDDELQQLTGPEYNSFAALAAAYNYTVI